MCDNDLRSFANEPQAIMLDCPHVDIYLQYLQLAHRRPTLVVSTAASVEYDNKLRPLRAQGAVKSKVARKLVPPVERLIEGLAFGDFENFEVAAIPVYVPGHYVLGIYDVKACRIHYYDSSSHPSATTLAVAGVFIKETVRQLKQRFHPSPDRVHFKRRTDSSYAKQSDGTSCGFFIGYYFESYLSLRQSTGFFMDNQSFVDQYRRRVTRVLLSVADLEYPSYEPLTDFKRTYARAGRGQVIQLTIEEDPERVAPLLAQHAPAVHTPRRHASIPMEAADSLLESMGFRPEDSIHLTPRAMFLYLRTIATMCKLPVAVMSPLVSMQKLLGSNRITDVGLKLHKPKGRASFIIIPFPLIDAATDYDASSTTISWAIAIHTTDDNRIVLYDPAKTATEEQLLTTESALKSLGRTCLRALREANTAPQFAVAGVNKYSKFSTVEDSAHGILALAECFISGSTSRLAFSAFDMDKYKSRVQDIFRQLHNRNGVSVKPLPGTRLVLASQQPTTLPPVPTQTGPRRSARILHRSEKDKASIFTRTSMPLLRPMNNANCRWHWEQGKGCAAASVNHRTIAYDTGDFIERCPHCDALLLASEMPRGGNQYTKCCAGGKVDLRDLYDSLQDMPPPLSYYAVNDPNNNETKHFRKYSKVYNTELAFGSVASEYSNERIPGRGIPACRINGEMTYRLSDMYRDAGHHEKPMWAQHYLIDPVESCRHRDEHLERMRDNPNYGHRAAHNPAMLRALDTMLREVHPFALAYLHAHEIFEQAKEECRRQNKQLPRFRLILLNDRETELPTHDDLGNPIHAHRMEAPRGENIAAVWVADDGSPPLFYGAYLRGRESGDYKELGVLDPNLDPALYPLLFPRGQQGYRMGIPLRSVAATAEDMEQDENDCFVDRNLQEGRQPKRRCFVSGRQFDRYIAAHRGSDITSPHWLYSKGRLAEFYTIDMANRRERQEFDEAQKKQQDMRHGIAKDLLQAFEAAIRQQYGTAAKLGKVLMTKPTVKGSRRYMQRMFANAMTIFDHVGKPSLFVTFTGNPQWPEIQALLNGPGDTWLNHPQESVRIFADKAFEFLRDILELNVLGEVVGHAISTELQARGMPHLHCLLALDPNTPGLGNSAYVDEYISAELPDLPEGTEARRTPEGRRQMRLYNSVVKYNVHDCNEWCLVGQPARCNKRFPKPYSLETVITPGRYPQYTRRAPKSLYDVTAAGEGDDSDSDDSPPSSAAPRRRPPPPPGPIDPTAKDNYGQVCFKKRGRTEIMLDNAYVVPYNAFLTEKYQCHINVEYCLGTACVSYALKYIMKGHHMAFVQAEQLDDDGNVVVDYNEYAQIQKCVYRTSAESALRMQGFPTVQLSHVVTELPVHGPGEESIAFVEGEEEAAFAAWAAGKKRSKLGAFFDLCDQHLHLTGSRLEIIYPNIGISHWFNDHKDARCWIPRQRVLDKLLSRVLSVSPKNPEVYAIRLLLFHVVGPTGFEDLRTVTLSNGLRHTFETFTEAAQYLGLLEDPEIWVQSILEAAVEYRNPARLRRYFAALLFHASPPNPKEIFDKVLDKLWPPSGNPAHTLEWRTWKTLNHLEYCFRQFNTSCKNMLQLEVPEYAEQVAIADDDLDVLPANIGMDPGETGRQRGWKHFVEQNKRKMNEEQLDAFITVQHGVRLARESVKNPKLFFLEGAGGTGKSFVYNTLIAWCHDEGHHVNATASTGIAATVLIGGKTLHSSFWIPVEVEDDTPPKINVHAEYATPLRETELIIVDEISMLHRNVLNYLDKMLRDVCSKDEPFGGKVVVIGGDWKQLCPVVKGVPRSESRSAAVNASVKKHPLFRQFYKLRLTKNMRVKRGQQEWADYIARIGNGKTLVHGTCDMEVDADLLVPSEEDLISFTFPQHLLDEPFANTSSLLEAAILAPKTVTVERLNHRIREMLPGQDIVCASTDAPLSADPLRRLDVDLAAQHVEHLNSRREDGMPPHLLTFRPGMILVLMKNYDQHMGLCNGTRLQLVAKIGENLKCRVLSGPMAKAGGFVLISKVRFEYGRKSDERNDKFTRIQFPVIPAFAMTINKAQGQTLQRVGLHLGSQVFSHGQIYTAFSRVTSREGIRVFNDRPRHPRFVVNRVFTELLDVDSLQTQFPLVPESQILDRDEWPAIALPTPSPPPPLRRPLIACSENSDDEEFAAGRPPQLSQDEQPVEDPLDWQSMQFDVDSAEEPRDPVDPVALVGFTFDAEEPIDTVVMDDQMVEQMENCVSFKVEIVLAFRDITKLDVHAIVNAAQSNLQAGGGVCGAVFRAAGRRQLQAECDRHGHCNTGDAVLTLSYDIRNVRNIIHAVGPKVPHGRVTTVHRRELASCYKQSLDLAKQHGLRSIAFPAISTGIYGYPINDATNTALQAVKEWLNLPGNDDAIERVVFCVFDNERLEAYRKEIHHFFVLHRDEEMEKQAQHSIAAPSAIRHVLNAKDLIRTPATAQEEQPVSSTGFIMDSLSYSRYSYYSEQGKALFCTCQLTYPIVEYRRPQSEVPPRVSTPATTNFRRSDTQPARCLSADLYLDMDTLRMIRDGMARPAWIPQPIDEEEELEAQMFLKEQEELIRRRTERQQAGGTSEIAIVERDHDIDGRLSRLSIHAGAPEADAGHEQEATSIVSMRVKSTKSSSRAPSAALISSFRAYESKRQRSSLVEKWTSSWRQSCIEAGYPSGSDDEDDSALIPALEEEEAPPEVEQQPIATDEDQAKVYENEVDDNASIESIGEDEQEQAPPPVPLHRVRRPVTPSTPPQSPTVATAFNKPTFAPKKSPWKAAKERARKAVRNLTQLMAPSRRADASGKNEESPSAQQQVATSEERPDASHFSYGGMRRLDEPDDSADSSA